MSSPVVIVGAGPLAESLRARLETTHQARIAQADFTTVHEAEVAFAGARTVVMLERASQPIARLPRAELADVDRLLADSVARAARQVGATHLVHFSRGDDDVQRPLLERAGLPLSVLKGGGPDPVEFLAAMVRSGPGSSPSAPAWAEPATTPRAEPTWPTCSIQRYRRPAGWKALDAARAYFEWLPGDTPATKTFEREGTFTIHIAGVRVLALRHVPGRSSDDVAWLEPLDGALVDRSVAGRFEFRVLLDGETLLVSMVGFLPALPFPLYRFSQAVLHERSMKHFGQWLEARA